MNTLRKKLRHAFAVKSTSAMSDKKFPCALEKIAKAVVERRMETPAIILLESIVPLSFLASQAMYALWPLVKMVSSGNGVEFEEVARSLEDRETVRLLAFRIEELAAQRQKI